MCAATAVAALGLAAPSGAAAAAAHAPAAMLKPFWTKRSLTIAAGAPIRLTLDPTTGKACRISADGPYKGQSVVWSLQAAGLPLRFTMKTRADATPGSWTLRAACTQAKGKDLHAVILVRVNGQVSARGLLASRAGLRVATLRLHPQTVAKGARSNVKVVNLKTLVAGRGGDTDPGDDYPARWKNAAQDSLFDNWREYNRECTSFAAWALSSRNGFNMPFYANAKDWGPMAAARGFAVNSTPAVGSIAWSNVGQWGHVAYVQRVSGGSVFIEEYNRNYDGTYSSRTVPASSFTGYIHFKDVNLSAPPTPPVTPPITTPPPTTTTTTTTTTPTTTTTTTTPTDPNPPASTAPLPPPPTTYGETAGGVAHTWTNYSNAGGTQGPSIASGQTVQIACRVQGFQVSDGNVWWYRIASAPWSSAYYVSADAFYNNGATSGSLSGTPFYDGNVATC